MSKQLITILIINDNAEERAELIHFLEEDALFANRILEEEHGIRGIKTCFEAQPDCVLLDLGLPEGEARAFLSAINPNPQNPRFAVVLLAAPGTENDVRQIIGQGAQDYLIKGEFSADALRRAVHQAIESLHLIKERTKTDAALRESQLQTYLALEAANTVAFTWDIKTDVVQRLYSGIEAFPKTENDTLADVTARVLEADRERFLENLQTALANPRQSYRAEYRIVQPDGSIMWLNEIGRFVIDENGRAIRLTGISTDITERKIVEEQLRASEARLHLGVEVAEFTISQIDYATGMLHLSKEAARLFGIGTEEITVPRETVHATFHPDDAPEIMRSIAEALIPEGEGAFALEHRIVRQNGDVRWLNVRKQIVFDRAHHPPRPTIGILAAQDVTERKRAEEALRESEEKLRLFVEHAPASVAMFDREMRYVAVSQRWKHNYQLTGNIIGRSHFEVFSELPERWKTAYQKGLAGEIVKVEEDRFDRADGSFNWLKWEVRPWTDAAGEVGGIVLFTEDITERKEIAEKLAEAAHSLAREREQLAVALRTGQFGAYEWNVVEHTLWWSPETFHLLGVDSQTFIPSAETFGALVHPDDYEELWRKSDESVARREVFTHEYRIIRPDGAVRWLYNRSHVSLNDEGEVERVTGIVQDITDRKEVEEKIRQSEERYRALVKAAAQVEWTAAPDGSFVTQQPTWEEFTGQSFEEYRDNGWKATLHPDDRKRTLEAWQRAIKEKSVYEMENRLRRRDGTYRWMQVRAVPILDRQGEIIEWVGANTDITERKEAEEEIRQNEKRFQELANSLPQLVWTCEPDGPCDFLSRQWVEYTGIPEKDQLGFGWLEQLHPDDREPTINAWNKAVEEGTDFQTEFRIRRHDGVYRLFDTRAVRLWDGEGKMVKWFGSNTDITERKEAEDALLEQQRFTQSIVEAAPSLTYIYDITRASNTFISPQSFPVLGYSTEEIHRFGSQVLSFLLHPDDEARIAERFKKIIADLSDDIFELEYRMRRKDGEYVWLFDRARVFLRDMDGNPTQILGVATDITTRRQAEEQLRYQLQLTQNITETAAVAIFVSDRDGRVTFLNPEAEKIFGYTIDELRGKVLHDAIHYKHPDGSPFAMKDCPLGLVYQNGKAVRDYESTFFRKDGTPVAAIGSNTPIIENGEVTGEVMAMLDITPRKIEELNAQLLLRVSELIREAGDVDALFTGIIRLLGERLSVARCTINLVDLENDSVTIRSEYKAASLPSLIGTFSLSKYSHKARRLAEKGQTIVVTDTQSDELTAAWFEESYHREGIGAYIASPLMRENLWVATLWLSSSEPREWQDWEIALVKTVGERAWLAAEKLRSEKKVRESEERFRLLTENLDNVFWILDWKTKRSEYVSRAFSQLYGEEHAASLSIDFENWIGIIHEEDRERAEQDFLALAETGRYESTYRIVLPDGSIRWRHTKGSPIRSESGEVLRVVGVTEDITDRKLAEMQILESEQRLRLATDVAEMFAWENDFAAQKITWSENAAKIIGCAPENLPTDTGDSMFFVSQEERERLSRNFERILLEGLNHYVVDFRGTNGQYWQAHCSVIRNQQGNLVKVVGVTQDITKRKRVEEKIQTANYRFRVAEEAAKGFNYEWNPKTGMVTRSESIERVVGYAREELPTTWQAWVDLIHPDDLSVKTEAEALKMLETSPDETFSGEYRVRHKEGHYIWLMERGLVIRDADGGIQRIIGQTMDIGEQKQTQEKLLEAERRAVSDYRKLLSRIAPLAQTLGTARELTTIYRALLDFIRLEVPCEGFFVSSYDAENQLKQVKYVWSEGREIDARAMQPIALFRNNGANSRAIREEKSIISTRDLEKMSGQFQVVRETNERVVESLVTPMIVMGRVIGTLEVQNHGEKYDQEHIVALEMAANLAAVAIENVRLMNVESEARSAAEAANRAKDEFLAMLSHELRSPLNAMFGWTQILQTTKPDAEKTAKAIEVIARNVRLQKTLIEDLLDVSRIISGKMQLENENVSLAAIVQEAVEAARPSAEKQDIRIELDISAETDEILGDRHRLQQVVGNLLTNAVKFTLPGGSIKIALGNADGNIKLTVEDTGVGIPPELLPRIFDRFLQADGGYKRKFGGLGLGLTIVKHLVELHGGTVVAHSEGEGRGATFIVEFPLVAQTVFPFDKSTESDVQVLAQNTKKLEGARILAVDDDRDVLDLMNFVLKQQGAVVTCANSAREALERLREESFNLMISDLGMAEMDGFDLIAKVREAENGNIRHLPAIALTGFVSAQDRRRVLEAGFQNHLSKPVDLNNLLKIVVNLIKEESTDSPA